MDSYQDWIDLDSNLTMIRTIIGIPREHANWWTIPWENNFLITKIQSKSLCTEVMKCDKKWQNFSLMFIENLTNRILNQNIDKDWKCAKWNNLHTVKMLLMENRCQLQKERIQNPVKKDSYKANISTALFWTCLVTSLDVFSNFTWQPQSYKASIICWFQSWRQ